MQSWPISASQIVRVKRSDMMDNMTSREKIAAKAVILRNMYEKGLLGGEVMLEDANPGLPKGSACKAMRGLDDIMPHLRSPF
ncbi:hypothetical protein L3476_19735 [Paenibacillus thiaminolyticus]|uniref:hypothetical protein n=1 Tax=Paenibacillus thiaminolyticus TaxID=49283 RepID=UPI0023505E61|nr:hypothetical protein [Paenibacillus thiaminolyticus]WCR25553.1 hypothetical protein L3476_19735 [Paenibacillus thiaminolyticus]